MTPEQLIEKMAKAGNLTKRIEGNRVIFDMDYDAMLRIVLKAISDGHIVDIDHMCYGDEYGCEYHIELDPEFEKFMEAK